MGKRGTSTALPSSRKGGATSRGSDSNSTIFITGSIDTGDDTLQDLLRVRATARGVALGHRSESPVPRGRRQRPRRGPRARGNGPARLARDARSGRGAVCVPGAVQGGQSGSPGQPAQLPITGSSTSQAPQVAGRRQVSRVPGGGTIPVELSVFHLNHPLVTIHGPRLTGEQRPRSQRRTSDLLWNRSLARPEHPPDRGVFDEDSCIAIPEVPEDASSIRPKWARPAPVFETGQENSETVVLHAVAAYGWERLYSCLHKKLPAIRWHSARTQI